jgi:putative transcriptional regulator
MSLKSQKFKSDALEAVHSAASALHQVGAINKATMRDYDLLALAPAPRLRPRRSGVFANTTA